MVLKLYNTLGREKQLFKPIKEGEVGFYSCGPTVYNYAHIGNLRTYIFTDLLKNVLAYNGYNVKHVMNITDVGHLTDDADSGEDKMEKGARREGKTVWDVARFYTEAFKRDVRKLNIKDPSVWCKATEHIEEMIELIKMIEKNGYTYNAGGNVYFDTSKFKHYNELGLLKLDEQEAGARTEIDENKRHPRDFVLWFGLGNSKFGESHAMKWDSPWGIGYPGWHIECSAMSSKYLGNHFDIHTGGIDHITVHHTNEIAQSESAFGKHPWVNYWLHANFLVVNKEKMAKSGGDFLGLELIEKKGYDPLVYRFFCLSAHYRSELNFSWDALDNAKSGFMRMKSKILDLKKAAQERKNPSDYPAHDISDNTVREKTDSYLKDFEDAINDDLNIPVAFAKFLELLNDGDIPAQPRYDCLLKMDTVLGLGIAEIKEETVAMTPELERLLEDRKKARSEKNWKLSDEIRDNLKRMGYTVLDSPEGQKLKKDQ